MMHAKLYLEYTKKGHKYYHKSQQCIQQKKSIEYGMACVFTHKVQFLVSGSGLAQAGMQTSYACQGDKLDLVCPQGTVIRVMRANYGRFSVGICNEHGITDWSVNCMAPRSLRILQDRYEDDDGFDTMVPESLRQI